MLDREIFSTHLLDRSLRTYLISRGVMIPPGKNLIIGKGEIDTKKHTLTVEYEFVDIPSDPFNTDEDDER